MFCVRYCLICWLVACRLYVCDAFLTVCFISLEHDKSMKMPTSTDKQLKDSVSVTTNQLNTPRRWNVNCVSCERSSGGIRANTRWNSYYVSFESHCVRLKFITFYEFKFNWLFLEFDSAINQDSLSIENKQEKNFNSIFLLTAFYLYLKQKLTT